MCRTERLPGTYPVLSKTISVYHKKVEIICKKKFFLQELYELEEKKILQFSTTRWLVAKPCVDRYLENKESLLGFFRTAVREDPKDREAALILSDMQNPFTEAYLHFLDSALSYMNEFNAMFQARDILIHKLSSSSEKLLKKFCQNFIVPERLGTKDTKILPIS